MILGLIKFLIIIALLSYFGFQFCLRLLKFKRLDTLIFISPIIGVSAFTFLLNLSLNFLDIGIAVYLLLLLLLTVSVIFRVFLRGQVSEKSYNNKEILVLGVFIVVLVLIFSSVLFANFNYDEKFHRPLISIISKGSFPPHIPFSPGYDIQYHYGFDLFTAAVNIFSKIPVWWCIDLVVMLSIINIILVAYLLVKFITKSHRISLFAVYGLFFFGGLRYLIPLLKTERTVWFWDYIRKVAGTILGEYGFQTTFFHNYSVDALGVNVYHYPTSFAMPVFFLTLIFISCLLLKFQWPLFLTTVSLLAYYAFLDESRFMVLIFAVFISLLYIFIIKKKEARIKKSAIFFGIILLVVLVFIQGGVFGSMIKGFFDTATSYHSEISSFGLRLVPGMISFAGFFSVLEYKFYEMVFLEWGFLIMLAPIVFIHFRRAYKNDFFTFIFTALVLTSIVLPAIINYPLKDVELTRLYTIAYSILGLGLGILVAHLLTKKRVYKAFGIIILILASVAPLTFNVMAATPGPRLISPGYDANEIEISKQVTGLVLKDSRVLSASPEEVTELWGVYVPVFESRLSLLKYWEEYDNYIEGLKSVDASDVVKYGVDYVYFNPDFADLNPDLLGNLIDDKENFDMIFDKNIQDMDYYLFQIK